MLKKFVVFSVVLLVISKIRADIVSKTKPCPESNDDICEIQEVRVDPCREAASGKPCKFKRGSNVTISFDYKPKFSSTMLKSQAYSHLGLLDLPLPGMDTNACTVTNCPTKLNELSTYTNTIFMSSLFPPTQYTVKWKLWDGNDDQNACCFLLGIRLV